MPKIHYILFAAILVVLSLFFDYHKTTNYKPQSTHTWRQSDCATFASTYYHYHNSLFKPRLYNRQQGDGYMVGEFPGLYYLEAQLYRIFGVKESIPRAINLFILFAGLFALFKMSFEITGHLYWSYVIPIMVFVAPVLTFYGNNFLPDIPAFGFLLLGWASFMKYYKHQSLRALYFAFFWFALAGLLKITMLMSVIALGGIFVMESLNWGSFRKQGKVFQHLWQSIAGFAAVVLVVGGWYFYSIKYNQTHQTDYFLNGTLSPWEHENMQRFVYTIYRTFFFWAKFYLFPLSLFLMVFLSFVVLLKKYPGHFLYSMTLLTFIGYFAIFQLWYYQFIDHDYYIISGYIYIIFLMLSSVVILKKYYPTLFSSLSFKIVFSLFVVGNIVYSKSTLNTRYHGDMQYKVNSALYEDEFKDYLTNLNITENDLVLSIPDASPNITLYLMGRAGFSSWIDKGGTQITAAHVRDFINRGAEYLIVHDTNYLEKSYVKPFTGLEIGEYKGVKIFDISNTNTENQ